jgi:hypothetical protein
MARLPLRTRGQMLNLQGQPSRHRERRETPLKPPIRHREWRETAARFLRKVDAKKRRGQHVNTNHLVSRCFPGVNKTHQQDAS